MLIKLWSRKKSQDTGKGNFLDNIRRALEQFLSTEEATIIFDVIQDYIEIKINGNSLVFYLEPNVNLGKLKIRKIAEKRYEIYYDKNANNVEPNKDLIKLAILFYNMETLYINIKEKTIVNFGLLMALILTSIYFMVKKK